MAAYFAQQPINNQYQQSSSNGLFTPQNSTPPSTNISPTNYQSHMGFKPIHAPKKCFYVPAVLRPTEMPQSRSRRPLTPPRSTSSSVDSNASGHMFDRSQSLPVSPADDMSAYFSQFGNVTRVVTDEWNEELGNVTGQPTRNHWKPDSSASCCASPTCTTVFSFLARRHHCRRCGDIFCGSHSQHYVPLDQEARFHPSGNIERSCDNCWGDFQTWRRARKSRASSIDSRETSSTAVPHGSPQDSVAMGITSNKKPDDTISTRLASVRNEDWNWSTF